MKAARVAIAGLACAVSACGRLGFGGTERSIDAGEPDVAAACTTETLAIADSADDGEISGLDWLPAGEPVSQSDGLMIGSWESNGDVPTWGYARWTIPADLAGLRVAAARLALWGTSIDGWTAQTDALRIWAEASPDASVVGSAGDAPGPGRPTTASSVRWPASGGLPWTIGAFNTSPDLIAVFAEREAKHGRLAAGAHVALWLAGDFRGRQAEVGTEDQSRGLGHAARLEVTACE